MGAPRTIDNDGTGKVFIGARFSERQAAELDAVAREYNLTRSGLIRRLVQEAYDWLPRDDDGRLIQETYDKLPDRG